MHQTESGQIFSRIHNRRAWLMRAALVLAVFVGSLCQIIGPGNGGVGGADPPPAAVTPATPTPY
ncbi:MAG: hypothetical protein ACR2JW_16915 [Thermomicrobiales bacterium]